MTYDEEKLQAMNTLQWQMRRIPNSVNEGSVQVVRQFKDWYVKAAKAVGNRASPVIRLNQLINQYESFK